MKASGAAAESLRALRHAIRMFGRARARIDWKHAVLDPDVLQRAMPARAAAARHRAASAEARERERRFVMASSSYGEAIADRDGYAGRAKEITLDGLTWWVPLATPEDAASVARYVQHQDFPYRAIVQTRELGIGGIMLDVGGNNGRMAVPRVVLGDLQAAYCAEPEPLNYACLVRNVRDNGLRGLVMADRVAIGADNGVVSLARAKSPGGHKVIEPKRPGRRGVIEVPCVTLDTWCERLGLEPREVSFVKIDAQGSEVHVLQGAARLLEWPHIAWQIEVDAPLLRERGFTPATLFDIVQRHFTHWVDLSRHARGPRVQPTARLAARLRHLSDGGGGRTDILVFRLAEA